jgi:hypothetical protein
MSASRNYSSTTNVDNRAGEVRRSLDRFGIRLEVSLCCDEVDQLLRQINVRTLKRTTLDRAVAVSTGDTDNGLARARGRDVIGITDLLQAVRAREVCEDEFSERLLLTVGVVRTNRT